MATVATPMCDERIGQPSPVEVSQRFAVQSFNVEVLGQRKTITATKYHVIWSWLSAS